MRKPKPGKSLAEKRPDLASTWSFNNPCTPYDVCPTTHKPEYIWLCVNCGGEFKRTCSGRNRSGLCISCSNASRRNKKLNPPLEKSLAYLYPEIAKTWSPKNDRSPFEVYSTSNLGYSWVCETHGEYPMVCSNRVKPTGCPTCWDESRSEVLKTPKYERSLEYLYPKIALEFSDTNDRDSSEVYAGTSIEYWWDCPLGHHYLKSVNKRTKRGYKCPYCTGKQVLKGFNDLLTTHPELCREWDYENNTSMPDEVSQGSHKRIWWKCKKGHSWDTTIKERAGDHRTGCPSCSEWGTSKMEQNLRLALLPFGASTKPNTKIGKWNVDIYFPDSKTIVEYDGSYAHSFDRRIDTDRRKSLELLEEGYKVIRIRAYNKNYPYKGLSIDNPMFSEILFCDSKNEISDELVEEVHLHIS